MQCSCYNRGLFCSFTDYGVPMIRPGTPLSDSTRFSTHYNQHQPPPQQIGKSYNQISRLASLFLRNSFHLFDSPQLFSLNVFLCRIVWFNANPSTQFSLSLKKRATLAKSSTLPQLCLQLHNQKNTLLLEMRSRSR